jgi:phosphatidylethanolamine/phosphatidyl-N-methylethanolamine N-methyltransferase
MNSLVGRHILNNSLLTFWLEVLRHPQRIGSVYPSSHTLSQRVAAHVPTPSQGFIVELGPGTGTLTAALLRRGFDPRQILCIEVSARFATALRIKFPLVRTVVADAANLQSILREDFGIPDGTVAAVISSIPFRVASRAHRHAIITQVARALRRDAVWIHYTYIPFSPLVTDGTPLVLVKREMVWRNCPPARIEVRKHRIA